MINIKCKRFAAFITCKPFKNLNCSTFTFNILHFKFLPYPVQVIIIHKLLLYILQVS